MRWTLPFALAMLSGCGLPRGGQSLVCSRHDSHHLPPEYRVPHEGTFHLHHAQGDGTPQPGEPIVTTQVRHHQSVGFRRNADEGFTAIAGDLRLPLGEGMYVWTMAPESELHGWRIPMHYGHAIRENLTLDHFLLFLFTFASSLPK